MVIGGGTRVVAFVLALMASALVAAATSDERLAAAESLYRTSGAADALPEFERLASEFEASGDARAQAIAIGFIGECHWRLGDYPRAADLLERALVRKRELGDRAQEARTLNVMGLLAWTTGDYAGATAHFEAARAIGRALGDRKLEGAVLNNLSLVGDELGDYRTSLAQYQEVLGLYREIGFERGEGDVLGNIGGIHLLLGEFRDAETFYAEALAISRRLDSQTSQSQDHGNLAMALLGQGRVGDALANFDRAGALAVAAGMRRDEALWKRGTANAEITRGRYDEALRAYRAAVDTYKEIGAQAELIEAYHDIGELYLLLGDIATAERNFSLALELASSIGLARGVTLNLMALGDLHARRGQSVEAVALYEQALGRAREFGEKSAMTESLLRLARVHRDGPEGERALAEAQQAIDVARETGAKFAEAEALLALADVHRVRGHLDAARAGYDAAESLVGVDGDPDLLWQIHYGRAQALVAADDRRGAVAQLQKAIAVIEGVRGRLRESRFRTGYVQDKYQVYVDLVRLQLEIGETAAAFSTAERLRAQGFLAMAERRSPLAGDSAERAREAELRERIRQLERSLEDEHSKAQPEQRQRAIATFSSELLAAQKEYEALLDDLDAPAGVLTGTTVPFDHERLRSSLSPDEALVEYLVDRDALVVFVVNPRGLQATMVPVRAVDIESKVELLRDLIRDPADERWTKPAASLAERLVAPLTALGVDPSVRRLYVVPHGVLNYLPFALLPHDGEPLIAHYALASLPSAAAIVAAKITANDARSMLVVAPARSGLRHAPAEASTVDALFRPHSLLLAGTEATESRFRAVAADYRNLHFATHGYFNKQNPLLSGVELEADAQQDGLLEVHEIMALDLNADLVTLSACQTGLGAGFFSDVPAGDDFIGLTRAFLYAGSTSVLATLWEVDDRSTGLLMETFYQNLGAAQRGNKEAALAHAQRQLLADPKYRHPYYWSAFVLVGTAGVASHGESQQSEIGS